MPDVFSVPIFLILLRETLEASIVVSVLLAFIHKSFAELAITEASSKEQPAEVECKSVELSSESAALKKRLLKQVWLGTAAGVGICIILGGTFIGVFYGLENNIWSSSEEIWEGVFSLLATFMITIVGAAMLRVSKLKGKWQQKLKTIMNKRTGGDGFLVHNTKKYSMFIIPFITVLREGLEAVIFVGGVGLSQPAKSFPLAVVLGLIIGILIGYLIYRGGNALSLQYFLIVSTCILYLIAAGLFSKAIGYFEQYKWNKLVGGDAAEQGSGLGSYDFRQAIWHVNYGNPEISNGQGWGVFNAILGWNNTGTYGSVISYIIYWWFIAIWFLATMQLEKYPDSNMAKKYSKFKTYLKPKTWFKKKNVETEN